MIVGTAYVEIKAVTDKVRKEIKDGFDKGMTGVGDDAGKRFDSEASPEIEKTGEKMRVTMRSKATKAGDESGESFAQRFKAKVSKIPDMMKGIIGQAGTKQGNDFGIKFWKGVQSKSEKIPAMKILLGSLTSFIPAAVSLVGELGGGLVALGSAVGQAAGTMPVLYSNMVPVMTLMGGAKLAFSGVGGAIKDLMSGTATPAKLAADMKKLGPSAQGFVKTIVQLKPSIDALKRTAADNLFPGLTAGIKGLMPLLPAFTSMIGQTNRALGNAAGGIGRMLGGADLGLMQSIMANNVSSVRNLTGALKPLLDAFLRVYHAMQPVQIQMTALAKRGAEWLDVTVKGAEASGKLSAYFQRSFDRTKQLGGILRNLATIVINVGKAASGAGGTMLQSISDITKRWADWTKSVKGQNSMKEFFDQTIPVMSEFMGIIGDIIKGVVHLGAGNKDLLPLLHQIREQLVPALLNLLNATTGPVAQSMITLLTDLVNIFAKISGSGSTGFLNSFVRSLDAVARVINTLLGIPGMTSLAGILGGIAGSVAAFSFVAGKLRVFKFAAGLLGFGKSAREASKGVDALKLSKMKEAEKLALNESLANKNATAYTKMKNAIKALIGGEGLAGLKTALGKGGVGSGMEAGAEGAAGGGIASKIGGKLKGGLGKLGGALGIGAAEGGAEGGGLAAIFGGEAAVPFLGEIAIAITAVTVGIVLMVKHWDAVKGFFTKTLPHALGTAASAVGDFFTKTIPDAIGKLPGLAARGLKTLGHALVQGVEWAIAGAIVAFIVLPWRINKELIHLATLVPGLMLRVGRAIEEGIGRGVNAAVGWLEAFPGRAAHWIGQTATSINNGVKRARDWLRDHIKEGVNSAVNWLEGLPSRSAHAIVALPGNLRDVARRAGTALLTAIRNAGNSTVTFMKGLPGKIKDGIGSLAHLLWDAGVDVIKGLYNGVVHGVEKFGGGIIGKIHSLTKHIPFAKGSPSLVEMAPTLLHDVGAEIVRSMDRGAAKEVASGRLVRTIHGAVTDLSGAGGPSLNAQFAAQVSGASGGAAGPVAITSPLIHIEHFHVRDERDITNLEHMLYRATQNISRANGKREVPTA